MKKGMEKKKSKIEQYLSEPWTWVAIATFLIWLWITRGTFTVRINDIEKELGELDVYSIKTALAQIQTDIEWIKLELQK